MCAGPPRSCGALIIRDRDLGLMAPWIMVHDPLGMRNASIKDSVLPLYSCVRFECILLPKIGGAKGSKV
jgi:hypothetical protein